MMGFRLNSKAYQHVYCLLLIVALHSKPQICYLQYLQFPIYVYVYVYMYMYMWEMVDIIDNISVV